MFQLKPYVSYKVADLTRSEFTARDLFDSTYAKLITDEFKKGKMDPVKVTESVKVSEPEDDK